MLGGCNLLPEPTSLIQAPVHVNADFPIDENDKSLAVKHLPKGTELVIPNGPIGMNAVIPSDFNGDGQEEITVLYRSQESNEQVGVFVLKKEKESWEKAFAMKGSGYEISWASATDVTGDGKKDLLLGWKVGNLAGNVLEIYTWEQDKFVSLQKLNYHELEAIVFEDDPMVRIAIWKKDIDDAYNVELLKWENHQFVADVHHYPSYFPKVVQYYQERTASVPDSALYWYFLADAHLKANHPELALKSVMKGMENKIVIPTYDKFAELQETIEGKLAMMEQNIVYDQTNAVLYLEIPKEIAPYITIEEEIGTEMNYNLTVSTSINEQEKKGLFSVEVYSKDMLMEEPNDMELLAETETFLYYVKRNENLSNHEVYEKSIALMDRMIQSVKPGHYYPQFHSLEEDLIIEMVSVAVQKYWYVVSGGKMKEGLIESFPINEMDYRYMGSDLNTKSKLSDYLTESYTSDAIQGYMKRAGIVEHKGHLAQPNADGGSIASYDRATIIQSVGNGQSEEMDLKVPIGSSLVSEYVHVEFQKTEEGWRISSEPGTF